MFDAFVVAARDRNYTVRYADGPLFAPLAEADPTRTHLLVDARVANLYDEPLKPFLSAFPRLLIEASEEAKTLDRFTEYIEALSTAGIRRGHVLVAIGGGVVQDITCFLAAILLRGLPWHFFPTTLLAQADSCIGSKSSINVGRFKNLVGTYTPPGEVVIDVRLLKTLSRNDIRSGIGEMLKVHAIDGAESFRAIERDWPRLLDERGSLQEYIHRSLLIKKRIIEQDEFDTGPRAVMNYGHSFGHAIESATRFAIPHGIAVTLGMDMANFISARLGIGADDHYQRMHAALARNYEDFACTEIPLPPMLEALSHDKKNVSNQLTLILPDASGRIGAHRITPDEHFRELCRTYLSTQRAH